MGTSSTQPILVTGATGSTGSAVLRELEQRNVAVRALVRRASDSERLGQTSAALAVADFDDPSSLAAALRGVRSAYLVTPSSAQAEAQQIRFAELAAEAGVGHIVKLSQLGADEASPVRFLQYHAAVERRIRELGIPFTFLRPNLFFQGMLGFARLIAETGRFYAPIGDARVSAVDVRDIAAVGAVALTEPGHTGKTYTITGPAAVTHAEMAASIGAAIGREVSYADALPEQFAGALKGFGMPEWQIQGLLEDYAHYRRGEAQAVTDTVHEVKKAPPIDFARFARDHAAAFR